MARSALNRSDLGAVKPNDQLPSRAIASPDRGRSRSDAASARSNQPPANRAARALQIEIAKTVLVLLLVVGVAEGLFRMAVPRLSLNSRNLAQTPARAQRISRNVGRPSVLILGNSMAREAIDAVQLSQEMGIDGLIELQASDSSVLRDWYYEYKNLFVAKGAVPDFLVLSVGDIRPLDRVKPPTEDLLHSFIEFDDLPELLVHSGIAAPEDRAAVYLSHASALYAFRGRTQKRILSELIPSYPDLRLAMFDWRARSPSQPPLPEPAWTTEWMEMLDALADQHGSQVLVVPLPTEDLEGRLRQEDRALCRRFGWRVIEPVADVPFHKHERPDGLHLTPAARQRFSTLLAQALAAELQRVLAVHPAK